MNYNHFHEVLTKRNSEQKDSDTRGQSQADDLALQRDQGEEVAGWDSEEYNPGKGKVKNQY